MTISILICMRRREAERGLIRLSLFLCAGRHFHLRADQWLCLRLAVGCLIPSRAHVHGLNVFGGAEDTNAYVYVPQMYSCDFAFELTLNKNWVIACDAVANYTNARKSKGYAGKLETGELADLSKASRLFF